MEGVNYKSQERIFYIDKILYSTITIGSSMDMTKSFHNIAPKSKTKHKYCILKKYIVISQEFPKMNLFFFLNGKD